MTGWSSVRTGVGLVALVAAASTGIGAHDPVATRVTWTRDIAPIFQARCAGCHKSGQQTPIPLTTYDEVRFWTAAIRRQVVSRKMPIWHAARGYGAFENDPSLSPLEIATIVAWADAGGPRGQDLPAAMPRAVAPPPVRQPPSRQVTLGCGGEPRLTGRLLAVSPRLDKGGSAGITALLPNGTREVVAWIRDFDPSYPTTYWLRKPIVLPVGSRLQIASEGGCSIVASLAR